ncbi:MULTISPECIES: hypothetical protein [Burkholderia]|uniref:hypothetical protein n=1 Tax=Burkholderia TaxID=32008 RepID=UPI00075CFB8A|nr:MULTISPECIES: hypothetical protein [Burkholderia]KVE37237.1 hypothetical protein WS68_03215 [Burkholderia sp. TSV86]MDN7664089.1 hypothetical protein [Burkholderia cenocepacia]
MQPLSERAKTRLRIAAGFLRARGIEFPKEGDFYGHVLRTLAEQPDKDTLRELVDWVEQYDAAESALAPSGGSRPRGQRPRP